MRPHGLKGEVIVALLTNRTERLGRGSTLLVEEGEGLRALEVTGSRAHQNRFLVSFAGVTTREEADLLRRAILLAEAVVDEEALFVHELIGCEVVELDGSSHGRVAAVQQNPASALLVGEEGWLVPLRFAVSHEAGRIVVDTPAGLFE